MENENKENQIKIQDADNSQIEISDQSKQVEFDVKMSSQLLFDYMINHTYTTGTGILATCIGAVGIISFVNKGMDNIFALLIGIAIILYFPIVISMKAKQAMAFNPAYKNPLHYVVDENGITVSQGETSQTAEWKNCTKAVSTKKSILVYTGKNNASIFPREQLGDKLTPFIATVAENMEPRKVKIRF